MHGDPSPSNLATEEMGWAPTDRIGDPRARIQSVFELHPWFRTLDLMVLERSSHEFLESRKQDVVGVLAEAFRPFVPNIVESDFGQQAHGGLSRSRVDEETSTATRSTYDAASGHVDEGRAPFWHTPSAHDASLELETEPRGCKQPKPRPDHHGGHRVIRWISRSGKPLEAVEDHGHGGPHAWFRRSWGTQRTRPAEHPP